MKKILTTVVLGLMLSGNAYSKSNMDVAIEKCADAQFLGNTKGISNAIYEDNELYKLMLKDKEQLQKYYDEYVVTYQVIYEEYLKDNPRPKNPINSTTSTNSFDAYKKAKVIWDKEKYEYMKPFTNKLLALGVNLQKQDLLIIKKGRSLVTMNLKKLDLKAKAKSIEGYIKKFKLCEAAHNNTPKGFMLEWGN
tara:strand:+ start:358 stop:936 length:579 start_codon:yes stop_codon:yes gene_type:complete